MPAGLSGCAGQLCRYPRFGLLTDFFFSFRGSSPVVLLIIRSCFPFPLGCELFFSFSALSARSGPSSVKMTANEILSDPFSSFRIFPFFFLAFPAYSRPRFPSARNLVTGRASQKDASTLLLFLRPLPPNPLPAFCHGRSRAALFSSGLSG